ncbi:MAG: 2-succinyl-5-enolpyruvyl-6-hydroxy-3-cyclohexene-1-carboxylic-acid synthase [Leptolyngbyaceae cyanobacterium SM1_1_3]|nr:2-succinyl-5-enolpyruvyl-6-hydroxy-3-cyclohexene-1-carboxylic-acid synthase [Leptolyngbyaceae cyanobacterium SM1_1_3]NJN04335.1 2-succinyl-5-enolpyruvyl-6-hydroxy-3-cyclohexene-1-carboxylic-acid synthase [Leptolyngbyaceae cyanobacterium RM1_1_2]NJO10558.1 2-succinyl-5-enolpyruvyl-6-hydroxy-3-cyclohexene-1-carboxylic-acid synthase [Leptolyngbyaceae cyanobacterium SL_1_1]
MGQDFRNTNTLWASVLVTTWLRLGLETAIICPGSRSAPLTVAIAQQPQISAVPILDERSAAFFALGAAKRSQRPVLLVCTSGTAGANFYPAVIEACESRVPLIILTADRPPELRDCASGQTVDQQKLFGHFPNWYAELALPTLEGLPYARQMAVQTWRRSQSPESGPVHLNCPFRDPLAPLAKPAVQALQAGFDEASFFDHLTPPLALTIANSLAEAAPILGQWQACDRGLIIAGPAQPPQPRAYCQAVAHIAQVLGWPVLAEGLSPLRNYASLNPHLITAYDAILRQPDWAETLIPQQVLQLGPLPTSKVLRQWLQRHRPLGWQVEASDRNLDPLHQRCRSLRLSVEQLALQMKHLVNNPDWDYRAVWSQRDRQVWQHLAADLQGIEAFFEGKVAWLLSQYLPPQTPLAIANSMPVRDVEYFWQPGDRQIQPFFNRGANGIDGTLSSALGMAHQSRSSVLLTGDLALLHDTNGLLSSQQLQGHLTIVLINNSGGGIFETLPISQFEPPFETFFAMPQQVDFEPLCAAYGVSYERITTWPQLQQAVSNLPDKGMRLLEIPTDRKRDRQWRQQLLDGQWDHGSQ